MGVNLYNGASPNNFNGNNANEFDSNATSNLYFRPSINLKAGIEIENGGEGTKDKPYVIK